MKALVKVVLSFLQTSHGKSFSVTALFDTEVDIIIFRQGGLLKYVARTFL